MQANPQVVHASKGHRQHQRDCQGDNHPGAHAQGEKAHQQHNAQRLGQHLHELADPGFHRCWLVRHFAQLHARREVFLHPGKFSLKSTPQYQNVATLFHGHGQTDGVFTHVTHTRRRRVVEAAKNLGHVTDAECTITHANREILDLVHRLEATGYP